MMIIKRSELSIGLPKTTQSICPDCKKLVSARLFEQDGKVLMEKECAEHGKFNEVVWSDAGFYLRAEKFAYDGIGLENPQLKADKECPYVCGLCDLHLTHTCLAILDLTNRCNLKCRICFANAATAGYVYEPNFEQVVDMMRLLRATRPVPTTAIQFSGGEPTIYPRFLDVVREARDIGFSQIQVATNGLTLAGPEFGQQMRDAGMNAVYLQFDGLTDAVYQQARGRELVDVKLKAVEHCRKVVPKPLSVVLVPTIVNTINDDQVGEITRYGVKNSDVIRSVNFQPVSFTGRISQKDREEQRYTLPDLVSDLEEQTDFLRKDDFYPVPVVAPISELVSVLGDVPKIAFTPHPHCGLATFVFIQGKEVTPVTRFIDIEGMFNRMMQLAEKVGRHRFALTFLRKVKVKGDLKERFDKYFGEYIDKENMPADLNIIDLLSELFSERTKKSVGEFTWRTMMIGGMHFQDAYNYDIERVKRCAIHYPTPDGRIIPFCAYNGGPTYRDEVEARFSVPLEEWKDASKQT